MKIRILCDKVAKVGYKFAFIADGCTFTGLRIFHYPVKIVDFIEKSMFLLDQSIFTVQ